MTQFSIHPEVRMEFDEAFGNYLGIDQELAASFEVTFFDHLVRIIAKMLSLRL